MSFQRSDNNQRWTIETKKREASQKSPPIIAAYYTEAVSDHNKRSREPGSLSGWRGHKSTLSNSYLIPLISWLLFTLYFSNADTLHQLIHSCQLEYIPSPPEIKPCTAPPTFINMVPTALQAMVIQLTNASLSLLPTPTPLGTCARGLGLLLGSRNPHARRGKDGSRSIETEMTFPGYPGLG